jgi:hypothetical protein
VELERRSDISDVLELHQSSAEARLLYIAVAVMGHVGTMEGVLEDMIVVTKLESRRVWIRDAHVELAQTRWKTCFVPGHAAILDEARLGRSLHFGNHAISEAVQLLAVEVWTVSVGPTLDRSQY